MPEAINGNVRDRHGQPIAEAQLAIETSPVPVPDVAALTGSDGGFQLTAPAPGTYTIRCTLPDGYSERRTVEIAPGESALLTVEMNVDR
jgi:hypothetical protein